MDIEIVPPVKTNKVRDMMEAVLIMPRFIDVSHAVEAGMVTYPGLPEPRVETVFDYQQSRARYADQAEFYIASLHMCGNTGTYVDAPVHRFRRATDIANLPLERLAHLPVIVIDAVDAEAIGPEAFRASDVAGKAVLVHTGFSRHWRTERYLQDNPYLTRAACEALRDAGAAFVGIDSLNIDDTRDLARPAHTTLLAAGIPICEHMTNLAAAPRLGGHLHAVPFKWVGGASCPVRAYIVAD
ncbi:MAG: cyclase family protein [Bryobacteraceae bacterium]|nr:cyclase family protein [Bryobacteraceae bacterium]